nr:PEGA domain-containing protein [Thermococcus sp. JdF3]
MVTPFTLILPVIPHDIYNVTAVDYYGGTLRIDHLRKVDTYNLSVGTNHTLLTAVIRLKPEKRYKISYSLKRALELVRVEEKKAELHRVEVRTDPEGASLVISGTVLVRGTSPGTFYLPPGSYTVTAFLNDSGAVGSFSVPGREEINLTLKPLPATLVLNVTPENASVAIDGEQVKNTSVTLSPGEHQVLVSANGYVAENFSVLLTPNKSRTIKVALKRLPVLVVDTEPAGARVSVTNQTCASPCRLTLTPGHYVVTASLEGYENASAGVYLKAGANASVTLTLEKIKQEQTTSSVPAITPTSSTSSDQSSSSASPLDTDKGVELKLLVLALVVGITPILLRRR